MLLFQACLTLSASLKRFCLYNFSYSVLTRRFQSIFGTTFFGVFIDNVRRKFKILKCRNYTVRNVLLYMKSTRKYTTKLLSAALLHHMHYMNNSQLRRLCYSFDMSSRQRYGFFEISRKRHCDGRNEIEMDIVFYS